MRVSNNRMESRRELESGRATDRESARLLADPLSLAADPSHVPVSFQEEAMEQTGWKLVHGDVFRPPKHAFW